jgi:DNA-binding MarR family transcriptional regulator
MATPLVMDTLQKFRIVIGAVRQHSRALETACGISGAQVWMLASIADSPEITVSQLSQSLSIHISTASNLLDKLARAGLVERLRSDEDRRVVRLRLTEAGQAIVAKAPRPLTGLVYAALDKLPEASLSTLNQELGALIQQLDQVDQSAAHEPMSNLVR